jgi:hypothetical protein
MKFKAQALCNSDFDQIVQFKVYDKKEEGPSTLIGTVQKPMNFFLENRITPILNA